MTMIIEQIRNFIIKLFSTFIIIILIITIIIVTTITNVDIMDNNYGDDENFKLKSFNNIIDNSDKIFWSYNVDNIDDNDDFKNNELYSNEYRNWYNKIFDSKFIHIKLNYCGRMKNCLLITDNGEKLCARYRQNNEQIFGEYYSFILARLLNITNVLPTILLKFDNKKSITIENDNNDNHRWSHIQTILQQKLKWKTNKWIIVTKYLDNLAPTFIPKQFRSKYSKHLNYFDLINSNPNDTTSINELVQWSDLIIFDYLIGNTDRMINNMINQNWNPQMMDNPVHNLLKQQQQQSSSLPDNKTKLIFIDNESGLFHGYRLLQRYDHLHQSLLNGLCIFRHSTIENLNQLSKLKSHQFLKLLQKNFNYYSFHTINNNDDDYSHNQQSMMPVKNFNLLRKRIQQVLKHVDNCRQKIIF